MDMTLPMDIADSNYKMKPMTITEKEFVLIKTLIYDRFGINLSNKKKSFIVSRLQKLLKNHGFRTFHSYYESILADKSGKSLVDLADFISTNYTYFNREKEHFSFFIDRALPYIVESLQKNNRNDIRIWCAGCSTGEEPYMLVMLLLEFFAEKYPLWDAGLLATDISSQVLETAKAGVYMSDQVSRLPAYLKQKYFRPLGADQWGVIDQVKREVTFRSFNLMNRCFPFKKPFDVIFCRNVMIYFDQVTRDALVSRFYNNTAPGGFFFIGHSESLPRATTPYGYVMPALYQK